MANYITVDGGTSKTRLCFVKDGIFTDSIKFDVGVKSCIGGNVHYKNIIKDGIDKLIEKWGLIPERILASGMITSEFGLVKLDHILAPAGISELNANLCEMIFPEISNVPFVFIRGVKMQGSSLLDTDIMRGEETEIVGIYNGDGIYVLTGSHSKIVNVKNGRIESFKTMLTGEMLAALATNTILSGTVCMNAELSEEYLLKGYEYCKLHGINEALFKVRVLDTMFKKSSSDIYSFYIGAVLCSEIEYILSLNSNRIVVSGNKYIKEAEYMLLNALTNSCVEILSDIDVDCSVSLGAVKIYEDRR